MCIRDRAKSIKDARKNMEFIEKKIKRRSPVKIKSVNYKDFEMRAITSCHIPIGQMVEQ